MNTYLRAFLLVAVVLRWVVAAVWFYEGTWCKILNVDAHQIAIVESLGPVAGLSPWLFLHLIGLGETLIGIAVLLDVVPRLLAFFQIFLVLTMNLTAIYFAFTALDNPHELIEENLPFLVAVAFIGFYPRRNDRILDASSAWANGALGKQIQSPRILFAQVREDAAVEQRLLPELEPGQRVFVIASAGCTAFALAAKSSAAITALDINAAQIALCTLKLRLIRTLPREAYLQYLDGDASSTANFEDDFWKNHALSLQRGLNHSGHIDKLLDFLILLFNLTVVPDKLVRKLLASADPQEQEHIFCNEWKNWRWHLAFGFALSCLTLRLVYGNAIVESLPLDFSRIIQSKLKRFCCTFPARKNPYLWQTFLQKYASCEDADLPPYLASDTWSQLQKNGSLQFEIGEATDWLNQQPPHSFHFFALSNIFETLDATAATCLWEAVRRAATPHALIVTRSITQEMPCDQISQKGFTYESQLSKESSLRDRSVICGNVAVYRRIQEV